MSLGAANLRTTKNPSFDLSSWEKPWAYKIISRWTTYGISICVPTFALNIRDQCSYILYIHGAYGRDPETTKTNRSFQQACEKFHPGHAPVWNPEAQLLKKGSLGCAEGFEWLGSMIQISYISPSSSIYKPQIDFFSTIKKRTNFRQLINSSTHSGT